MLLVKRNKVFDLEQLTVSDLLFLYNTLKAKKNALDPRQLTMFRNLETQMIEQKLIGGFTR